MSTDTTNTPTETVAEDPALAEAVRLADGFLAGTNELDAARRRELIESTWTTHGHFIDPLHEAAGHDGLDTLFAQVHATFPGYVFTRTSDVERVDRWFRFGWELRGEDGTLLAAGTDTCEIADGALARVVSFYDHLATA